MRKNIMKNISRKYCPRFGQVAVGMGFITEEQMIEAFRCQVGEELSGQGHRLLGSILMDKDWMTSDQVEQVLNVLMKKMRIEEADQEHESASAQDPDKLPGEM